MEQNLRNASSTLLNHELLFKAYLKAKEGPTQYDQSIPNKVPGERNVHYNLMNDKTDLITHQQDVASLIPGHYTLF